MNAPNQLSQRAKTYWAKLAEAIEITDQNCEPAAILCNSLAMYWEAQAMIQEDGLIVTTATGIGQKPHPALAIQGKQFDQVIKCCKLLGIGSSQAEVEDELGDFFADEKGDE